MKDEFEHLENMTQEEIDEITNQGLVLVVAIMSVMIGLILAMAAFIYKLQS